MKKTVLLILALWFTASPVMAETAYDRVIRSGEIRCGYFPWPLLTIIDPNTNKKSGVIPDTLRALSEKAEIKITMSEEASLTTYLQDLKNNRYDMECAGGWPNPIRAKFVMYTKPIAYYPLYAWVRHDDNRFDKDVSFINNSDIRVVVADGGTDSILRRQRFPLSTAVELAAPLNSADQMILNVTSKKADVAILDTASGFAFAEKNPNIIKPLSNTPLRLIKINFSVAPGEVSLLNFLDTSIDDLIDDGTIDQILDRYDPDHKYFLRVAKPYKES